MHLSFNSIQELDAFLSWARSFDNYYGVKREGVSGSVGDVAFDTPPCAGENCGAPAAEHSTECVAAHERAYTSDDKVQATPNAEPVKRKRRTKAEIEADEKAAADAVKTQEPAAKVQETPADASAAPEGANPFAAAETAAETPATPAGDTEAADTTVTPFQHLTRAREFIAKHGMPKYNESFAKAGLDANVMGYSAYQRALHMDALTALEAA